MGILEGYWESSKVLLFFTEGIFYCDSDKIWLEVCDLCGWFAMFDSLEVFFNDLVDGIGLIYFESDG